MGFLLTIIKQNRLRMVNLKSSVYGLFLLLFLNVQGYAQADTAKKNTLLTYKNFLLWVELEHPVAKQSGLFSVFADAEKQKARGAFDPKLFYSINNKTFDQKNYYRFDQAQISTPTWIGADVKIGYENNSGLYVNPEEKLPKDGLLYTQISLPLLQGLIVDERRTAVRQAEVLQRMASTERQLLLNELFSKASKAYFQWQYAKLNLDVLQQAYDISKERYTAVTLSAKFGDRPFIDTVEAAIQLQDRLLMLQQGQLETRIAQNYVEAFLWDSDRVIQLDSNMTPEIKVDFSDLNQWIATQENNVSDWQLENPTLKYYNFKAQQLELDRRWKKEKLKPRLDLKYNPLFDAGNVRPDFANNFKWGLSAQFPLFLRKERGDLRITQLKLKQNRWEADYKRADIGAKIKSHINEWVSYRTQFELYGQNILNYEKLWRSEKRLFENGESTLFMINAREISYMNARLKGNELLYKSYKSAVDLQQASGKFKY